MPTTVIYSSESEQPFLEASTTTCFIAPTSGATAEWNAALRSCHIDATRSKVQDVSNTGTSLTPNATFSATPTSGNLLVAIIGYADNNAITTGATGWTLLSSGGATGRRIEVWCRRSDGTESGAQTWTKSAGSVAWAVTMIEVSGYAWAAVGYGGGQAVATAASDTTTVCGGGALTPPYGLATISAFQVGGGTITNVAASYSGSITAKGSLTTITTHGRGGVAFQEHYNNEEQLGTDQNGVTWTWTTSRTIADVHVVLGGSVSTNPPAGRFIVHAGIDPGTTLISNAIYCAQTMFEFDTSSIPDDDVITSVTMALYGDRSYSGIVDAVNADLEVRTWSTDIPTTRASNDSNLCFATPSELSAQTLLASFAAASSWSYAGAYNTLTSSGSNFVNAIDKTGTTRVVVATSDQRTDTARTTQEMYGFDSEDLSGTSQDPYISIVHTSVVRPGGSDLSGTVGGWVAQDVRSKIGGDDLAGTVDGLGTGRFGQAVWPGGSDLAGTIDGLGSPFGQAQPGIGGSDLAGTVDGFAGIPAQSVLRIGGSDLAGSVGGFRLAQVVTIGGDDLSGQVGGVLLQYANATNFDIDRVGGDDLSGTIGGVLLILVGGTVAGSVVLAGDAESTVSVAQQVVATVSSGAGAVSSTHLLRP